jgi:hypothetical protein
LLPNTSLDLVGSRRAFATALLPLEHVLATRHAYGVTLNDIVLAAVTGALRQYCLERGLDPSRMKQVRAVVPVDNRSPGDVRMGSNGERGCQYPDGKSLLEFHVFLLVDVV